MKPLLTNQRVLVWLCAYSPTKSTEKWKKCVFIVFSLFIFTLNLTSTISSAVFFWKYVSTDLEESLYALFQVCGSLAVTNIVIIAFLMQQKTTETIERLSEIYDENKNEDSFRYLAQANNKSELMWSLYFKYMMGSFLVGNITASIASVLICFIMNGHYDSKKMYRLFKFVLPWNQTTPLGYTVEIFYSICVAEAHLYSDGMLLLLFISICLHHQAFYKMFCHSVRKMDRIDENRNDKEFLCILIRFHITVKDWFLESAKIYSPFISIELIPYTMVLACTVFQLDLYFKHIDFNICILLLVLINAVSILFVFCFFGKLATESFNGMNGSLYNANWYELPIKLRKYFILMIENTQKPVRYCGFGAIILNLETFCALLKSVATYYTIFKTLTSD